jgi:hypothetical protein
MKCPFRSNEIHDDALIYSTRQGDNVAGKQLTRLSLLQKVGGWSI